MALREAFVDMASSASWTGSDMVFSGFGLTRCEADPFAHFQCVASVGNAIAAFHDRHAVDMRDGVLIYRDRDDVATFHIEHLTQRRRCAAQACDQLDFG